MRTHTLAVIPADKDNAVDVNVKVLINAIPVRSGTASTKQAFILDISEYKDLPQERNVIEVAVDDGSGDTGAIWRVFDPKRVLSVRMY